MVKKLLLILLAALMLFSALACGARHVNNGENKTAGRTQSPAPNKGDNKGDHTADTSLKSFRGYGRDVALLSFEGAFRGKLLLSRIDREDLAVFDNGEGVFKGFTFKETLETVGADGVKKLVFSDDSGDKITLDLASIDLEKSVFAITKGDEVIGLNSEQKVLAAVRYLDGSTAYHAVSSTVWTEN